jgi:hypothetical protein
MMRLPMPRFLLADGIGAVFGNSLFFLLGFWLGQQFADLVEKLEKEVSVAKPVLLLLLLLAVVGYLLYQVVRRPIPTGDPEELPLIGHQVAVHLPQHADRQDGTVETPAQESPAEGSEAPAPEEGIERNEEGRGTRERDPTR